MSSSNKEQELYDFIKSKEKVTIKEIQENLSAGHVGALGKLIQQEKIIKRKLRVEEGYGVKMVQYYLLSEGEL